jgi:hypothetical protein
MYQLVFLFFGQFSELNRLLAHRYRAERTFLYNQCVTDELKGNVLDVQPVFGDKYIKGKGAVGRTFIGQIGEGEPANADILYLAQLVRFLPDGCEYTVHRFESFLHSAVFVVVIGQF